MKKAFGEVFIANEQLTTEQAEELISGGHANQALGYTDYPALEESEYAISMRD